MPDTAEAVITPVTGAPPVASTTLFRFATAGSVDDGKSTLVGRLLHDSKAILADQLEQVARTSAERGFAHGTGFDFALLTDGLRAEREQGITIDVAYRYFSTDTRSFILADCPGHVQYTRNMVTGATTADAVVVLIDGRKGVLEQTRRHLAVVALLRVPHVIVAVNKIDLLDYSEEAFTPVDAEVRAVTDSLGIESVHVLPVSALEGDNIVTRSERTPWYQGPALLELLETLPHQDELDGELEPFRLPVQLVLRPQGGLSPALANDPAETERLRDYRAVAGRISSGSIRVGDEVQLFPAGISTTVTGLQVAGREVEEAAAPQSISVQLADDIDAARGSLIVAAGSLPRRTPRGRRRTLPARRPDAQRRRTRPGQARHIDGAGDRPDHRLALRPRLADARTGRVAEDERHRPRPPAFCGRPASRAVLVEPPWGLVPGHSSRRRCDARCGHRPVNGISR